MEQQQQQQQAQVTQRELLEKGLATFRRVLDEQPIKVKREEMCDLLNFEVSVNALIENMKATEGKTPEELLEMAKQSFGLADKKEVPA